MRTYAQLTTSFVIFCNRVGVDESISFWGGSEVIAPNGQAALQRAALRRGPVHRRHPAGRHPARAARPAAPARRAARSSRSASWPGSSPSGPAWRPTRPPTTGAEAGLDVAPGDRAPRSDRRSGPERLADRRGDRRPPTDARSSSCPTSWRSTPTSRAGSSAEFIRGQLRQAGFERAVLGPVGRDRLGARRLPRRRGDRAGAAALRADALPDVVAGVARRRRGRSSPRSAAPSELVEITPDGRRLLRRRRRRRSGPRR